MTTATTDTLLISSMNGVCTLTINRPQVRNAVDGATMLALRDAIVDYAARPETRVFVITGAGGAFSSGADIQAALQANATPSEAIKVLTEAYAPAIQSIRACPWPVIAAVDGYAAGIGCDLALACDIRLVSDRGAFAELFIRVGLIPDGGGTFMLPRLVGLGKAFEMMVTGETVKAEEALAVGLANKIFSTDTFAADVTAYAEKLAQQSPHALVRGKKALYAALEDKSLVEAMAREAKLQQEIFATEDGFEGFRAFIEKRAPKWTGK